MFCRIFSVLICLALNVLVAAIAPVPVWARILLSNSTPVQGETIELTYFAKEGDIGGAVPEIVLFGEQNYKLFPKTDNKAISYHCLIVMPATINPGKYSIKVGEEESSVTVKDAGFPVQKLTLPKSKDNFIMSPGEEEAMDAAKAALSDQRLWQGVFVKPCQARISAQYGIRRIVNGHLLKDYFHSGADFAGSLGQTVKACADGKVILAHHNFRLHGNVVAIDHGQGVVTVYIHLQKISVKEGEQVAAGQQIGTVGATGRANGPHLHLSLYVNKVAANPMPWFSRAY